MIYGYLFLALLFGLMVYANYRMSKRHEELESWDIRLTVREDMFNEYIRTTRRTQSEAFKTPDYSPNEARLGSTLPLDP